MVEPLETVVPFRKRWLPVVAWAAIVLLASSGVASGNHTAELLRWLFGSFHSPRLHQVPINELNLLIRKTAHVLQFFAFALLVYRALNLTPGWEVFPRRTAVWVLGSATLLAIASEAIQLFSPQRSALVSDVLLDVSGAVVAMLLVLALRAIFPKRGPARSVRPAELLEVVGADPLG